jgi:centrosomal protein CEP104
MATQDQFYANPV